VHLTIEPILRARRNESAQLRPVRRYLTFRRRSHSARDRAWSLESETTDRFRAQMEKSPLLFLEFHLRVLGPCNSGGNNASLCFLCRVVASQVLGRSKRLYQWTRSTSGSNNSAVRFSRKPGFSAPKDDTPTSETQTGFSVTAQTSSIFLGQSWMDQWFQSRGTRGQRLCPRHRKHRSLSSIQGSWDRS